MERPMTTEELFIRIKDILEEKRMLPDILDYGLATSDPDPVKTYEFALKSGLDYGGSEGIYLDFWIEYYEGRERCRKDMGTFKTLREDREAMHVMAGLQADFIVEERDYLDANQDDFTWEGADVRPADSSGKRSGWGYSCRDMESAMQKKDELLKRYPQVVVRDNATRKEKIYKA